MSKVADMAIIHLKYVSSDIDRHGNARHYLRRPGHPKIRLPGLPGTKEFMDAYHEAMKTGKPPVVSKGDTKSMRWLLEQFYKSATFKQLEPRSQRVRRLILEGWVKGRDDKPFALVERRHILQWRDEKAATPGAATNLVKALRHVFKFATEYGHVKVDPTTDVKYLRKKNGGFHSWTAEDCLAFEKAHPLGTRPRLAYALLLYTGARRSDVVTFGKQMLRDGRLHYVQQKTKKRMATKLIRPLIEAIEATPSSGLTFLETERGTPYTSDGLGNVFRDWCDKAGLPHCSAHGLRKALAARLAEAGASSSRIQAALGHESLSEADRYTRQADSMRNSDAAFELIENTIVPLRRPTSK